MNLDTLIRMDRKSLLALAQKQKIPGLNGLSREQLAEKLAGKTKARAVADAAKVPAKTQPAPLVPKSKGATGVPDKKSVVPVGKNGGSDKKASHSKGIDIPAKTSSTSAPKSQAKPEVKKSAPGVPTVPPAAASVPNKSPILVENQEGSFKNAASFVKAMRERPAILSLKSVYSGKVAGAVQPSPKENKSPVPAKGELKNTNSPQVKNPKKQARGPAGLPEAKPQKSAARDTSLERYSGSSAARTLPPTKQASPNPSLPTEYGKDRVVVLVRDPHWVHCYWEISRQTMNRAQAALGQDFDGAQPALRLVKLGDKDCGLGEQIVREFHLPEGARNWYLDVPEPGTDYCVDVGYRSKSGRFYGMGRSNAVATPRVAWSEQTETVWTEQDNRDAERLFALSGGLNPHAGSAELRQFFEEKLGHNPGSPSITSLGSGGFGFLGKERNFTFQLDADLVVHGSTEPSAKVTFQGEPIPLRPDGTFSLRFRLADGRHIMPAVSVSCTGMEERTIVLAVERNTKTLEPVVHEEEE